MKPYYERDGVTLYHGDCREILPQLDLPAGYTIITDPVWPNSVFPAIADPQVLLREGINALPRLPDRLVLHLGCSSDPRFTAAIPADLAFLRVCWLRYARPSYRGRILIGSDVAYVFGQPPAATPGAQVLPGEIVARNNSAKLWNTERGDGDSADIDYNSLPHPAPRRTEHVSWLIAKFGPPPLILDPFCGTGTTLFCAKRQNLLAVGIEIEERYCEIAAERLSQRCLPLDA